MASASVLQRLHQRAKAAEEMISTLKIQIDTVKRAAGVSASKPEEARLKVENAQLKKEIDTLKLQLALAEIRNGVKQVPLPSQHTVKSVSRTSNPGDSNPSAGTTSDESKTKTEDALPQGDKKIKGTKPERKEGKENTVSEPKAKKAKGGGGGEKKVEPENIDISRLDLRVGKIVAVKKHPDADSLYIEEVDLGEGRIRTIVSGLVKHVPIEQMQDRMAVFMCNLKPAKMRGILSEGMIMCASTADKVEILITPEGSNVGDRVTTDQFPGEPDALLNPKKKIWETIKPDLKTDGDKVAAYKGARLQVKGKGFIVAPSNANSQIQ